MTPFTPVTTIAELGELNRAEIVEGYLEGLDGEPEPGHNRGASVHHGWVNGMIDSRRMEKTEAAAKLAREVCSRNRASRS